MNSFLFLFVCMIGLIGLIFRLEGFFIVFYYIVFYYIVFNFIVFYCILFYCILLNFYNLMFDYGFYST